VKLFCLIALSVFASCSPPYLNIKRLVQNDCESYIPIDDIQVSKRDSFYVANILNDSIYTDIYYFIVHGNNQDEIIWVADDKKLYWMEDSLCKKIIDVNRILKAKGIEIAQIYIDGANDLSIRAQDVERKYLYKVVDVKILDELLNREFVFSSGEN
jgi:hypothetical protein